MSTSIGSIPTQSFTSILSSQPPPKDYQSIQAQPQEEQEHFNPNHHSELDSNSNSSTIHHITISKPIPLPRPKLWPILITFALLDLLTSIYFLSDPQPNQIILLDSNRALILDWTFTRAFLVGITSTSRRIRTLGWVFASTGMISILLLLWTTNEFVQNNHRADHTPVLPFSLASFLTMIILLFFFPLAHWFAFLVAVGITKARNPFVGHSLGLANSTRSDYWNWAETNDQGALERVMFLEDEAETISDEIEEVDDQVDPETNQLTKPSNSQKTTSGSSKTTSSSSKTTSGSSKTVSGSSKTTSGSSKATSGSSKATSSSSKTTSRSSKTTSRSSTIESITVTTDEEPDRVLISPSPTSITTTDQELDDQDPDRDEIQDIPPPPITPLTPSRTYHYPIGSSSSCSRVTNLRNRNSWLSKQAALFEEAEERHAQRRSSLPHHQTASCSNGCQTHLPIPDSFRNSSIIKPKKPNPRPVSMVFDQ